jgi:hypothetical protein
MMDMERRYRQLQRATVARSALDVIAIIFLLAGFAFWGVAFWQLLTPPALLSLLSIQAAVLAIAFSLAAPLLLSMLVPTTPAGQLLQKTQWATIGFYVILAAALFLVYQAEQLIELWLYAQPAIAEARYERRLAIVLVISFVVVPALAWVQLTPERWMAAVQQAHAVKKLEMQQRGELAIVKASLIRAEMLAARGWANLLPLEQEEAIGTLRGLLMASADSMRSVVKTLGLDAELSRSIMGDDEIADQLAHVQQSIDVLPTIATHTESHQPAAPNRVALTQGDAARNGDYTVAYERFGVEEAWTVRDLAGVRFDPRCPTQKSDALHEELVEVGRDNRQELYALEQRCALLLGFVQNPPVELEPA